MVYLTISLRAKDIWRGDYKIVNNLAFNLNEMGGNADFEERKVI